MFHMAAITCSTLTGSSVIDCSDLLPGLLINCTAPPGCPTGPSKSLCEHLNLPFPPSNFLLFWCFLLQQMVPPSSPTQKLGFILKGHLSITPHTQPDTKYGRIDTNSFIYQIPSVSLYHFKEIPKSFFIFSVFPPAIITIPGVELPPHWAFHLQFSTRPPIQGVLFPPPL